MRRFPKISPPQALEGDWKEMDHAERNGRKNTNSQCCKAVAGLVLKLMFFFSTLQLGATRTRGPYSTNMKCVFFVFEIVSFEICCIACAE